MLDPAARAMFDQGMAAMMELMPSLWHNLFIELQKTGFTESQSFDLLKVYILSQGINGVKLS
jgi:hypothetical protein